MRKMTTLKSFGRYAFRCNSLPVVCDALPLSSPGGQVMIHYAVLRHGFDISRNPTRLGGSHDEPFWLKLGHSGEPPRWLTGNVLWLVSWEGTMKMRHMLYGWYVVERVGKCQAVISQYTACGHEG